MSATIVPIRANRLLTKRELAEVIGRSPRWIELRQHEGLPVALTDRHGRRLYDPRAVKAWMDQPPAAKLSTADRLASLEREMAELRATIQTIKGGQS